MLGIVDADVVDRMQFAMSLEEKCSVCGFRKIRRFDEYGHRNGVMPM